MDGNLTICRGVDIFMNEYFDISHTNDLLELGYYCDRSHICWGCLYEELCWTGYKLYGFLMARELREHYFTMIYSEGES